MKCVVDTSAISWLGRIGYLDLLKEIYDKILAPKGVFKQLEGHRKTKGFVKNGLERIILSPKEEKKFNILIEKWMGWLDWKDITDVEVFVAYCFFSDAD